MALFRDTTPEYAGMPVQDRAGETIGTLEEIVRDEKTGWPRWLVIDTGRVGGLGSRKVAVPAEGAQPTEGAMRVPVVADAVRSAPEIHAMGFHEESERNARRHWGLDSGEDQGWMTVSEEELRAAKVTVPYERVRLVKRVVEEDVQVTVRVRREVLDIVRDELPPGTQLVEGQQFQDAELTIVLLAEEPVVTLQTIPVERVRLTKHTVVEDVQISDQVRRERVELQNEPLTSSSSA